MPKAKKKKSKKVQKKPTGAKKSTQASKALPKPAKADTGEPRAKGAKRSSGLNAAATILAETGEPMSCKAITERMIAQGLWQTTGKTPTSTIYAAIIREIAAKGDKARFRKTGRAQFELVK